MNRVEYLVESILRVVAVMVVVVVVVVVVGVVIRVLAYMMPADQENTSTPHFDLVKCGY